MAHQPTRTRVQRGLAGPPAAHTFRISATTSLNNPTLSFSTTCTYGNGIFFRLATIRGGGGHGTTRPKGIDRDARSAEEGECEEFHQFHHGEVEVVCVLLLVSGGDGGAARLARRRM